MLILNVGIIPKKIFGFFARYQLLFCIKILKIYFYKVNYGIGNNSNVFL